MDYLTILVIHPSLAPFWAFCELGIFRLAPMQIVVAQQTRTLPVQELRFKGVVANHDCNEVILNLADIKTAHYILKGIN